jgi:hypothetical protein
MDIKSLVDPEAGLIDRRIFADREIYELERERLSARCWLYLGHESDEESLSQRSFSGAAAAKVVWAPLPFPTPQRHHEIRETAGAAAAV